MQKISDDCCTGKGQANSLCPSCKKKGRPVKIITLKSLLLPSALERLEADSTYSFCANPDCSVVYFNDQGQIYRQDGVKVPVYPKDTDENTPICYCFGWTRKRIIEEIRETGTSSAPQHISQHIQAKRCGCEVNNPQGACCLGNVREFVKGM